MIGVTFKGDETIIKSDQHVYQWDTGQKIMVSGLGNSSINQVHFSFNGLKTAYPVNVTISSGTITVNIPNIVLRYGKDVYMYLCIKNTNGTVVTIKTVIIPVIKRNMPENYMYDDDELVATSLDELQTEIQRSTGVDTEHETRITSLEEAKTNASGTTFDTLKERIDTTDVYIDDIFDKINCIDLNYPNDFPKTGYFGITGTWASNSSAHSTDYILVTGCKSLTARGRLNNSGYILAFFNEKKQLLSDISVKGDSSSASSKTIEIDLTDTAYDNVVYVTVSAFTSSSSGDYYLKADSNGWVKKRFESVDNDIINVVDSLATKTFPINLVNPTDIKDGGAYNYVNGVWTSGFSDYSSYMCEVEPNTDYYISDPTSYVVYYDENMVYIVGHGAGGTGDKAQYTSNPVTTPSNCKYMATHVKTTGKDTMYVSKYVDKYIPYGKLINLINEKIEDDYKPVLRGEMSNINSSLRGKKINAFGDSITSTDYTRPNWWEQIAERTGATFVDYGFSGTTLAHTNDRHLWNQHFIKDDAEEIGYVQGDPTTWGTGNCFCERIDSTDETADGIIIMGGTNDNGVSRGAWDSTDTSTFFGGLNVLITKAIERFAGKPILICTPMQSKGSSSSNVADPLSELLSKNDTDTLSRQLRAEAIKAKCNQYGIHCLDLFNTSGINGDDSNAVYYRTNDTLHPSAIGQYRLSTLIQAELEKLF